MGQAHFLCPLQPGWAETGGWQEIVYEGSSALVTAMTLYKGMES